MKRLVILFLFLFSSHLLSAQWTLVPGSPTKDINAMELSEKYLYVSTPRTDSALIRIDLTDFSQTVMKNSHGKSFTPWGWKKMAAMGNHIFYTDGDTLFVSHDYGNTWVHPNVPNETGMYMLAYKDTFFYGGFKEIFKSTNYGQTFSTLYNETYYTNVTEHPLLVKKSELYFSDVSGGLRKININQVNSSVATNLYAQSSFPYSMVSIADTFIAASTSKVYKSEDGGISWSVIYGFSNNYVNQLIWDSSVLYAATKGVYLSFNYGKTFLSFNDGLNLNNYVSSIKFDSLYIYAQTDSGIFRRPKSDRLLKGISGQVYNDNNNNQVKDAGEKGLSFALLKLVKHNHYFLTDGDGNFKVQFVGINDSVRYLPPQPFYLGFPSSYFVNKFDQKGDFAVKIDTTIKSTDFAITRTSTSRPGKESGFSINCNNYGGGKADASIKLIIDSLFTVTYYSDSSAATLSYDTLTWRLTFDGFEKKKLTIRCSLPDDPNLTGDTLWMSGWIEPYLDDYFPADNLDTSRVIVINSFDPNDITVSPEGDIHNDFFSKLSYLNYYVRFQNTGTDTAFNVIVKNQISDLLNFQTFQFVGSSHPCKIQMDTNRIMTFTFNNIMLPHSFSNEPESHGYLRYKIKPQTDMLVGEEAENNASIYFDNNFPAPTNTVVTLYSDISTKSGDIFSDEKIKAFPNPVNDYLFVQASKDDQFEFLDIYGRKIELKPAKDGMLKIEMKKLPQGIYLLRSVNNNSLEVRKIIKTN